MIRSIFLFIQEGIMVSGHCVRIVIQMQRIMHYLIAFIAIPLLIGEVIILMLNVIIVIQEEVRSREIL